MDVRTALIGLFGELGFQQETLSDETRLREDLAIDSTELVEIAIAIERRVSVRVDTGDFHSLDTFGEMVELVESAPAKQAMEEVPNAAHSAQHHDRPAAR
jgi:acyl carrier protein